MASFDGLRHEYIITGVLFTFTSNLYLLRVCPIQLLSLDAF